MKKYHGHEHILSAFQKEYSKNPDVFKPEIANGITPIIIRHDNSGV